MSNPSPLWSAESANIYPKSSPTDMENLSNNQKIVATNKNQIKVFVPFCFISGNPCFMPICVIDLEFKGSKNPILS